MKSSNRTIKSNSTPSSVYMCAFLLVIIIGRVQEIFMFLTPFRPVLLLAGLTLALSFFNRRILNPEIWRARETRLSLVFWAIGLVTVLFSVWPGGAFQEWRTGLSINLLLFLCLIANMQHKKELLILNKAAIVAVLILSLSVIFSPDMSLSGRQSTTKSYDPNDLALLLVSIAPLAMAFFFSVSKHSKIFYGGVLISMLLVLLKTGSRGGLIGLSVIGLIFLFSRSTQVSFIKKVLIMTAIGILIISFAPESLWQRFQEVFSGTDYNLQSSEEGSFGRLQIWETGLHLLIKNPLFGIGAGQFSTAMGQTYGKFYYKTAHNSFLQVAVEVGIPGFVVFLTIIFKIVKNIKEAKAAASDSTKINILKNLSNFSLLSIIGFLACAFFLSQAYSAIIPFFLANSYALSAITQKKEKN